MKFALSRWRLSRERKKEKESTLYIKGRRKARVDVGVASAFDKRCARRAPVARVTCGRRAERGVVDGEEKGHLNYSFLKRAWLGCFWGSCVRVSALLEKKKRGKKRRVTATSSTFLIYYPPSRVARRWLQEAIRDALFSSLNSTQLLLRLSVCFSLSFFSRHKLRQNLIGRSFVGA